MDYSWATRARLDTPPITAPTLVHCECGRHVVRAPGYHWWSVAHVFTLCTPDGMVTYPCENGGSHDALSQALNMEQLLRDVESW